MKTLSRLLSLSTLVVMSLALMYCGGPDPDPNPPVEKTEKEKATELLTSGTGIWATSGASGISVDGTDVTADLFQGFNIKFTATSFTTAGTSPVFERTDTWTFKDETAKVMIRGSDNKEMTITSLTATQLKFTLEWDKTTFEGGRSKSIPGTYEFTLTK